MSIGYYVMIFADLVGLVLIMIIIGILLKLINIKENNKKEKSISTYTLKLMIENDEFTIVEKVDSLVDRIIKNNIDTYMIMNVNFNSEKYINSKEADEMTEYIKSMTKLNMTPEIIELIKLVRVINSENDLDDYLDLKIKIHVISIIVNVNKPIQ